MENLDNLSLEEFYKLALDKDGKIFQFESNGKEQLKKYIPKSIEEMSICSCVIMKP